MKIEKQSALHSASSALLAAMLGCASINSATAGQRQEVTLKNIHRCAAQGDANCQLVLGTIYHLGVGSKPDVNLAFIWTRRAALQGHSRAQVNLGLMYLYGEGVAKNETEAVHWIKKADQQGDPHARLVLYHLVEEDEGYLAGC